MLLPLPSLTPSLLPPAPLVRIDGAIVLELLEKLASLLFDEHDDDDPDELDEVNWVSAVSLCAQTPSMFVSRDSITPQLSRVKRL